MKTFICLFLFLLFQFAAQEQMNCEESKLHAVYYATRCCYMTFGDRDTEFVKCHAKYSKRANRPRSNLTSTERIAINICAHDCSLHEKQFFKTTFSGKEEFDLDAIEDYFLEKYPGQTIFSTYMIDTFRKCIRFDSLGEVNIKYPNVTFLQNVKCEPFSARIMMCVRTKAMQSCPPSAWENDSFDCAAAKIYFKECVGSIEKVIRNMD